MYLNKTAELTEQIILVPHIIEMSCRITQRKGDKHAFLQTPEMSLASFAFFSPISKLPNCKVVKVQLKAEQTCLHDGQSSFCCCVNDRGTLEPVNIAGSIPADRK